MSKPSFTNVSLAELVHNMAKGEIDVTKLPEISKLFVINLWNQYFSYKFLGLILFLLSIQEELTKIFAIVFVIGSNLVPPLIGLLMMYALSNFVLKSQKKVSDPTNVNLFDRGLAIAGLVLPCAEISRFFPHEIRQIPLLHKFQIDYLTGLMMFLNLNQIIVILLQVFCFRELIRRRGPDTEWAGSTNKKLWIKYFIRYYWCYGFCLTTILEPYNFIQVKLITLLDLPIWVNRCISEGAFFILGGLLLHAIIFALIGVPNRVPLFHGACEFHVGRPKKG